MKMEVNFDGIHKTWWTIYLIPSIFFGTYKDFYKFGICFAWLFWRVDVFIDKNVE